jgi:hypothetical protein
MEARVEHDIWYIGNFSLRLDINIVCRTVLLAFRDEAAVQHEERLRRHIGRLAFTGYERVLGKIEERQR